MEKERPLTDYALNVMYDREINALSQDPNVYFLSYNNEISEEENAKEIVKTLFSLFGQVPPSDEKLNAMIAKIKRNGGYQF